jgi:hypothetical protein
MLARCAYAAQDVLMNTSWVEVVGRVLFGLAPPRAMRVRKSGEAPRRARSLRASLRGSRLIATTRFANSPPEWSCAPTAVSSAVRGWGGFTNVRGKPKLLGAGVLFENLSIDASTSVPMTNPFVGRIAYLFPQGAGRCRAYLMYEKELPRLQSENDSSRFVDECVKTGIPLETYAGARQIGPLASFDMSENWGSNILIDLDSRCSATQPDRAIRPGARA